MGNGRQAAGLTGHSTEATPVHNDQTDHSIAMDAIRKKMKSLKDETDQLYAIIQKFEDATKEANRVADQADCDIRDYGKKVHGFEIEFDETLDKLNKANNLKRRTRATKKWRETLLLLLVVLCSWKKRPRRPKLPWPTPSPSLLYLPRKQMTF